MIIRDDLRPVIEIEAQNLLRVSVNRFKFGRVQQFFIMVIADACAATRRGERIALQDMAEAIYYSTINYERFYNPANPYAVLEAATYHKERTGKLTPHALHSIEILKFAKEFEVTRQQKYISTVDLLNEDE